MTNLPSYIKPRDPSVPSRAQRLLQNLGSSAGPYLSIEGNRFSLVDSAGNHQAIQTLHVDVCIIDANDHLSKMYFGSEYDPNNPAPPLCFSDNGVAPSFQARQPQALTCEMCPHGKWGSKISAMGTEVKACRDEQKVAIIVPGMPNNIFRLTIPPNSLKNFKAYLTKFVSTNFDYHDVITRITFQTGVMGTLEFNPAPQPWLDEQTAQVRDKAWAAKAADIVVGRLDRPRQASLPAPTIPVEERVVLPAAQAPVQMTTMPLAATQSVGVFGAGIGGGGGSGPTPLTPTEQPQKRRRRTAAEIAADNAKAQGITYTPVEGASGPSGGTGGGSPGLNPRAPMAPFRPEPNGATPPPQQGSFGIQAGTAPNPDLVEALKIFDT